MSWANFAKIVSSTKEILNSIKKPTINNQEMIKIKKPKKLHFKSSFDLNISSDYYGSIAISNDNSKIVGATGRYISLFDIETGNQIFRNLVGDVGTDFTTVQFSPDDKYIAVGNEDELILYNLETESKEWTFVDTGAYDLKISNAQDFIIASMSTSFKKIDFNDGSELHTNTFTDEIYALELSKNDTKCYIGFDGYIKRYDIDTWSQDWHTNDVNGKFYNIKLTNDEKIIVCMSDVRTDYLNPETGGDSTNLGEYSAGNTPGNKNESLAITKDDLFMFYHSNDDDSNSFRYIKCNYMNPSYRNLDDNAFIAFQVKADAFNTMKLSSDNKYLAVYSQRGAVLLYGVLYEEILELS